MEKIPAGSLRECGACHDNLKAHMDKPETIKPGNIPALSKTEQNQVCGKCHYNQELFGRNSINPNLDHGLLTSVGFEGKKEQLSCLDCHQGHGDHNNMLQSIQAHTCFKCHKEAIVTMGVFQPINYVVGGEACTSCHAPHGTTKPGQAVRMIGGFGLTCVPCHI